MDPANLSNRLTANTPFIKNFPLIGVITRCKTDDDCKNVAAAPGLQGKLQCNSTPIDLRVNTGGLAIDDPPAGFTQADLIERREGGPRCDVPAVGFGSFCAPGIARCRLNANLMTDDKVTVEGKAVTSGLLGYTCQPMGTGYCYFRCDSDAGTTGNSAQTIDIKYAGPGGTMKTDKATLNFENRCGNMPGYKCLNPSPTTPAVPTKLRVCLRSCDTGKPDPYNDTVCGDKTPANLKIEGRNPMEGNVQKGMSCSNRGIDSAAGCQWDPAFEPRDTNTNFVPR
jgi:hypothetical protein